MKRELVAGLLVLTVASAGAQVKLSGRVVDENNSAVAGAQVSLRPAGAAAKSGNIAISDPTGKFGFEPKAAGDYLLGAECQGYFRLQDRPVRLVDGVNEVTLALNPAREVFSSVDVSYSPPALDLDRTVPEERLSNNQLLEIPYPSTNTLRNVFRAVPGIVQDSRGGVHLNGAAEDQVLYTLDGFQINDPLTGRFEARLNAETVRSMEVSGMNPAEFGKGSAGTLAIKTSTGDDQFRYSATNFVPGVENRKGLTVGGWTPRLNFSGPIRRGRAWFSDGVDVQYDENIIEELPAGHDRTRSWRLNNLLRNQVNLTPSNILYTGFLASFWTAPRNGLSALDPLETTVDRRSRQWFFNIKDQVYFGRGALLETGYASNRTFGREIPQGHSLYVWTPEGRSGNYFADATRTAGRDQFLANLFLPSFHRLGGHQFKVGVDVDTATYWQETARTGYMFLREDGNPSRRVFYQGNGVVNRSNTEASSYLQDSWKPRPSLLLELGLRQDWDRLLDNATFAPRAGFSWAPPHLESTKFSGGYGVVYEQTNLRMFSRPLDQYFLTTHFFPGGAIYGPAASIFTLGPGPWKTPRYANWNLGVEQRFGAGLYARVQYTRRRGSDGLTYVNSVGPGAPPAPELIARYGTRQFDAVYQLQNLRRDVYDAFEITVRQAFRKQYEWMASYTRSRAFSNAVTDVAADDPMLISNNVGRMPWDSPNRLISWGYLPTRWPNWAVAYMLETRNGYPFSVNDEIGRILGGVNSYRFPVFFELNLHLERRFVFRKNRWAFRFGFNNITNHKNYNVVNADTSSQHFMTFYGGQSRALNFRLRWLGKL